MTNLADVGKPDFLFGNDAVRGDGVGNDHVMVDYKEDPIAIGNMEIEDLVAVPKKAVKFVNAQGRMPPVVAE